MGNQRKSSRSAFAHKLTLVCVGGSACASIQFGDDIALAIVYVCHVALSSEKSHFKLFFSSFSACASYFIILLLF